jgi:hypothetical protein
MEQKSTARSASKSASSLLPSGPPPKSPGSDAPPGSGGQPVDWVLPPTTQRQTEGARRTRVARPKAAKTNLQLHRDVRDWFNFDLVELCLL